MWTSANQLKLGRGAHFTFVKQCLMRGEIGTPKYINSKVALIILVLIPLYLGLRPSH